MTAPDSTQNNGGSAQHILPVKDAVRCALSYLRDLYEGESLPNLRLEEVELSDDETRWFVTFGFTASERDIQNNSLLGAMGGTRTLTRRDYKRVVIDAYTGKLISLKIRNL